jgi:hypothetical protein
MFASGVTHSTNVHSIALEGGHEVVCFFIIRRTNVGSGRGIIERYFKKQLTTKLCGGKLGMLRVVVKNCNYSMNHIKTMQQWCGSVLIVAQWKCESMFTTKA